MKKQLMLALAACGLSSAAMAGGLPVDVPMGSPATSDAGIYLGLGAGYGVNGLANFKVDDIKMIDYGKTNNFVGRVFLGYDINRYFAVEAGYSYFFSKPEVRNIKFDGVFKFGGVYKMKRTNVVDLMGKIKVPVCEGFDIYGKVGANYLMSEKNSFNVAYGAGIDWSITNNFIVGLEWSRFNAYKDTRVETENNTRVETENNTRVETENSGKGVVKHYGALVDYSDAFMATIRYKFDI